MQEDYEMYFRMYHDKSDDKLSEIAGSNEYTEDARMAASDILKERGSSDKVEDAAEPKCYNEDKPKEKSTVGEIIKMVAWIGLIASVIISILFIGKLGIGSCVILIISSFLGFLVSYALGEICCLLADIKENTKRRG